MIKTGLMKVKNEIVEVLSRRKSELLSSKKGGFSLVEVVIAITLMAILSGIGMTSYTKAQRDAKKNMDYTTAANIATAAQLADADGLDVSIDNLVDNNYLQSSPTSQQDEEKEFTVTIDDNGKVIVKLDKDQYYPKE